MATDSSAQKSLVVWTIAVLALAVVLLWAAYLVRDILLLLYISGLLAIGFSPIVRLIERQKVLPIGTRRFPRWLAILILYLVIIGTLTGIGFMIVPPLVDQAQQFWTALPGMFERAQVFLIRRGDACKRVPMVEGERVLIRQFRPARDVVGNLERIGRQAKAA